eukprot:CAMPEP_0194757158 /NCGR_PEP_ID=MMETSP0323_2-20130528/10712_1 /TAXON_ID=2866 ORGANISM="Crypthecodinium cohnii, Strain Seligo" /NCGR_SAMPLE_ID=MMETSP0323_2 /ASSEMBLY_ACC=CAM_ASM_000346 /LENGTH=81 /DNA_ID=CAMNT_0039676981 /DNA_START=315 /DNA_END=560 /DNA_ORIENTATION=-
MRWRQHDAPTQGAAHAPQGDTTGHDATRHDAEHHTTLTLTRRTQREKTLRCNKAARREPGLAGGEWHKSKPQMPHQTKEFG